MITCCAGARARARAGSARWMDRHNSSLIIISCLPNPTSPCLWVVEKNIVDERTDENTIITNVYTHKKSKTKTCSTKKKDGSTAANERKKKGIIFLVFLLNCCMK